LTALSPFSAKNSLGQNFLVDPNLARKLVDALQLQPEEPVLEIGPGLGALTTLLIEQSNRVTAVEIDGRLIPFLQERFSDRLELVNTDILSFDLAALAEKHKNKVAVLGNLPYYASSPILFYLLDNQASISRAVITLQSEVVDRCCAKVGTKDYGILTIRLALAAPPKRLFTISPNAFRPQPKVKSAVMSLDFGQIAPMPAELQINLAKVVRAAFGQRRKIVRNALSAVFGADLTDHLLQAVGISPQTRAEQILPEGYLELARSMINEH